MGGVSLAPSSTKATSNTQQVQQPLQATGGQKQYLMSDKVKRMGSARPLTAKKDSNASQIESQSQGNNLKTNQHN